MAKNLTGSGIDRAIACPAAYALPAVDSESSEFAEAGTARHAFLQNVSDGMEPEDALAAVPPEHHDTCAAIPVDILPTHLAAEVAFAFDVTTGEARELGRGIGRDYSSATKAEVCCTVDLVGVSEDRVVVVDFKGPHAWIPRASVASQLLFGALCACQAYGKDAALIGFIRLGRDEPWSDFAEVDLFDLLELGGKVQRAIADISQARVMVRDKLVPDVKEGPWCKYCPAFNSCPAKTALIRSMLDGEEGLVLEAMSPVREDNFAAAWHKLQQMEQLTKMARSMVYAAAAERPMPLGDGRWVGRRETQRKQLDGDIVWEVISNMLGRDYADQAVTRSATQKALEPLAREMVRAKAAKTQAEAKRLLLDAIDEAGGLKIKVTETVKEFSE